MLPNLMHFFGNGLGHCSMHLAVLAGFQFARLGITTKAVILWRWMQAFAGKKACK